MKIAVPETEGMIFPHFGHCEHFVLFEAEEGKILHTESIENPGHRPGFLPGFLKGRGVDVLVAGNIGESALDLFRTLGIKVVTGAGGDCRKAAEDFLTGKLDSTSSVCHNHHQEGSCGH